MQRHGLGRRLETTGEVAPALPQRATRENAAAGAALLTDAGVEAAPLLADGRARDSPHDGLRDGPATYAPPRQPAVQGAKTRSLPIGGVNPASWTWLMKALLAWIWLQGPGWRECRCQPWRDFPLIRYRNMPQR